LISLRGNTTPGIPTNINDSPISRPSGPTTPNPVALGGICNEDIRVPDKMVGLSKSRLLLMYAFIYELHIKCKITLKIYKIYSLYLSKISKMQYEM
jgi:hypothetical protein